MCTGIKFDYEEGSILGRTMDLEYPVEYSIVYMPRKYDYCKDLEQNILTSRYKTMGLSFFSTDPLKDGINEEGLMGITNDFSGFNLHSKEMIEGKINISSLDFMTYILGNYKTVEGIRRDIKKFNLSNRDNKGNKVLAPDFHFYFVDKYKDSVVIEPKKGQLFIYENPYQVMTNSPDFWSQERKLKKYLDLENLEEFNSAKNLPGGYDPISRFIKAFFLTKSHIGPKDFKEALAFSHNILSAMSLPYGFIKNKSYNSFTYTRYITAYDSKNLILTVKREDNPNLYTLKFSDIKDQEKRLEIKIPKDIFTNKLIEENKWKT